MNSESRIETRGRKKGNTARIDASVDGDVALFLKSLRNKQGAFISKVIKRTKAFREFNSTGDL